MTVARPANVSARLTYGNVVATLALFVALGGASYAAIALPANSVGTRQLAFPIGLKSLTGPNTTVPVQVCPAGASCPSPVFKTLESVQVSLKRSSEVLVLGSAVFVDGSSAKKPTIVSVGIEANRNIPGESYQAGGQTTRTWRIVFFSAGHHTARLVAGAQSESGPARGVNVYNPQITVIALPRLG